MVRPSGWTVSSRKENVYACVLRPTLMKTAWQSASLDNAIKHRGAGKGRGWRWWLWGLFESPVTAKDMSRFRPLVCRDTLYPA